MKAFKKKTIGMAAAIALILSVAVGCGTDSSNSDSSSSSSSGSVSSSSSEAKKVEIAILNGMAPYTYADENGDFQGYDYEFLTMADELIEDYEFHYNLVDPDAAAAAIQAGTYALSCSAHFVTPARKENFILSDPNCYYPVNLISRKEDSFTKFEDLNGKVLVPNPPNDGLYVVLYEMAEKYPDVKFTQEEVSNYVPYADGCRGVENGQWDVWFGGDTMFYDIMEEEPMDLFCSEPIGVADCVVVLNKDQTDLRDKINKAIAELKDNGSLSELSKKWLGVDVFDIKEKTDALAG